VPFLLAPVILIADALLGSRAGLLTALAASASVAIAGPLGDRLPASSSVGALGIIWLTALVSWATARNLYTALHWSWAGGAQAERNLAEVRSYQGRLAGALRQLEEANYRLERANHALTWARAEADQARRLKAQFAAHVSHELRTPINLIVGFAELMLANPEKYGGNPLPRAYLSDLTAVHRNARHLQGLIDDILDLSQIEAGEMPVIRDLTDVGAIVSEAVATARQLLERKGLAVEVVVTPGLPLLQVDRLRIRQVLLNLLNNAARFTEQGGVGVRAFRDDGHVVVEVRDTGVGIASRELGKLFEPFHQVETSPTRGRGGTGLGLAISKRFVELHGGLIWARSEGVPGRGSTFGFALPIQPAEEAPHYALAAAGDTVHHWALPAAAPLPTVVVLDDDPAIVGLFQRHLEGYQVLGAADEGEAIELATSRRAHAIVTDLPAASQIDEWHRRWRDLASRTATRVLGCPMPSGRRVARSIGLVDYLVKPVTQAALFASVRAVAPGARTVLVVDDEPQMVRLLCGMLRSSSESYEFQRAYDGAQALDLMGRTTPDLVLLDLLMPQVDGLTVLEKMKQDPALAAVPVVAVSARGAFEAISPSAAQTLVLVSDDALPVNSLLRSMQATLDSLPPAEARPSAEARAGSNGRELRGGPAASAASG
jgi:signal transduction histidine kinase/DNA-binding response OmpR family regulator